MKVDFGPVVELKKQGPQGYQTRNMWSLALAADGRAFDGGFVYAGPECTQATYQLTGTRIGGDDADGDGVADSHDLCPGQDDRPNLNRNGTPDCRENLLQNGQF